MTLSPFEVYQIVTNLKLHFKSSSYDYIKYKGKGRATEDNFNNRTDKVFYQKIAKHKDTFNYILANVLSNPNIYVRDLAYSDTCEKTYTEWLKRRESLTYIFKNELDSIDNLKRSCDMKQQQPELLQMYLGKKISIDTIALVLDIVGITNIWNKKLAFDIIWQNEGFKIQKYVPFLPQEKSQFKKILVDKLRQK